MHRISSILRITIGLVCLSLAVLLAGSTLGFVPDQRAAVVQGRAALCESMAVQCSLLASKKRLRTMGVALEAIVERNPEILYAAVRRAGETPLIEVGDRTHAQDIRDAGDARMSVPISENNAAWGKLEVVFEPTRRTGIVGLAHNPTIKLCLFFTLTTFVVFFVYLKKLLQALDPSRVVPDRVRTALDTLAEGLLVLDAEERIVLANKSFSETVGQSPEQLLGRCPSEFDWGYESRENAATDADSRFPWQRAIADGETQSGAMLDLDTSDAGKRSFVVNSSPILSDDGEYCGELASFDDVTAIEQNRAELEEMLKLLKTSRDEVRRKNNELQLLATQDSLTGCLNRRAFFEAFEKQWKNAERYQEPLACVLLDVDHFKSVNDRHGHTFGDQVLQKVAILLEERAREGDYVCRYGGEEFCVLLTHTDVEGAAQAAERYRQAIEATDFGGFSITASLGVSTAALGARDPQALIDEADQCLYIAKRAGRNQTCRWDRLPVEAATDEPLVKPAGSAAGSLAAAIPFHAVTALVSALAYRDARTAEHSRRVADLAVAVAGRMLPASQAYIVEIAALLHDIGKIGVPDAILLKPGPLTDEEWKVMGLHDQVGVEIIRSSFACDELTEIIENHHAWYGGNPRDPTLPTGQAIPLGARILSMADAFDAIVSDRVYRAGRSQEEAFAELRRCAGVQFDPELVESFIDCVLSRDLNRHHPAPQVTKEAALSIGLQIESLAYAIDSQDTANLANQAELLKQTAEKNGVDTIGKMAAALEQAVREEVDQLELLHLTTDLLDLCRSTQTAYLCENKEPPPAGEPEESAQLVTAS